MEEIWKPIDGYPDYDISNLGRVKSKARMILRSNSSVPYLVPERILALAISRNSKESTKLYYSVPIRNEDGKKTQALP
jgi:hypothetical protein